MRNSRKNNRQIFEHNRLIPNLCMNPPTAVTLNDTENKHSPFIEVKHNSKVVNVQKTKLVWV